MGIMYLNYPSIPTDPEDDGVPKDIYFGTVRQFQVGRLVRADPVDSALSLLYLSALSLCLASSYDQIGSLRESFSLVSVSDSELLAMVQLSRSLVPVLSHSCKVSNSWGVRRYFVVCSFMRCYCKP